MTVCIAAECPKDRCMILASDFMLSTTDMSADEMIIKMRVVGPHWIAQYAGNDISSVTPIVREVIRGLRVRDDSLENMVDAFVRAYRKELSAKVENEVLRPIGYSFEEFKLTGSAQLGSEYSRSLYDVERQTLDVQFLIAGFDGVRGYIFSVGNPGKVTHYSDVDFWAIGSGQANALSSFFNCRCNFITLDLPSALYRVCEAKFNAESAPGVGSATLVVILREDGTWISVEDKEINTLRTVWEKTKVLQVPHDGKEKAKEILRECNEALIKKYSQDKPPVVQG